MIDAPYDDAVKEESVQSRILSGKKLDRCSKVIIRFPVSLPSALVKR